MYIVLIMRVFVVVIFISYVNNFISISNLLLSTHLA